MKSVDKPKPKPKKIKGARVGYKFTGHDWVESPR